MAHSTPTNDYDAAEVHFTHHDTQLAGLLLLPRQQGPHPAVVLHRYTVEQMLRLDGFPQSQIEQALTAADRQMTLLRRGAIDEVIASQRAIADQSWFAHFGGQDDEAELHFLQGIIDFDPVPILERVRCPLLGIWGAGDVLVPAHRSAAVFAAALAKAGNDQFRLELFPSADHRIAVIEQATGHEQVQWSPARRFAPGYLETMTGWLHHSVFHTDNAHEGLAG